MQSEHEFQLLTGMIRDGFAGVNDRLDTLNGRVNEHSVRIATLDERTGSMPCGDHGERFVAIEMEVKQLKRPLTGRRVSAKRIVIFSGGAVGVAALLERLWNWIKHMTGGG